MTDREEYKNNVSGAEEKRSYIRTRKDIPLLLKVHEKGKPDGEPSVAKNISATGMMIEVSSKYPAGIELKIELQTPEASNPVHCIGRVIWATPISGSEKFHCGVEFVRIEEDNKNTFLKFLCDTIYKSSDLL
ncbi:MAG: PilZ domain-containing protein [Candidatus Omnitrophota bacterium]